MQTIYRLKPHEISMAFLKSLKTLFAGKEVEIIVKSVEPEKESIKNTSQELLNMIFENREKAPVISDNIDIRGLIDDTHHH